jgi:hypothetical protein
MENYAGINKPISYLLLIVVTIMLILDIQDGTLDIPVIISHCFINNLSYINNLKLSHGACDIIFLNSLLVVLNTYFFNFNFAILFDMVLALLNAWASALTLLKLKSKTRQRTFPKLTFLKYHITTIRASIHLP